MLAPEELSRGPGPAGVVAPLIPGAQRLGGRGARVKGPPDSRKLGDT